MHYGALSKALALPPVRYFGAPLTGWNGPRPQLEPAVIPGLVITVMISVEHNCDSDVL